MVCASSSFFAPKTRDDASKTFDEAKKAFDAGDYKWAIALWEAVLDWAAHSGGSEQAHIVADTTYALALAKAHAGDLAEAYADAKKIPVDYLRGLGLSDVTYLGQPAIRIPYLDAAGSQIATRFRPTCW